MFHIRRFVGYSCAEDTWMHKSVKDHKNKVLRKTATGLRICHRFNYYHDIYHLQITVLTRTVNKSILKIVWYRPFSFWSIHLCSHLSVRMHCTLHFIHRMYTVLWSVRVSLFPRSERQFLRFPDDYLLAC